MLFKRGRNSLKDWGFSFNLGGWGMLGWILVAREGLVFNPWVKNTCLLNF